jgi:hypothetical protein
MSLILNFLTEISIILLIEGTPQTLPQIRIDDGCDVAQRHSHHLS